MNKNDLLEVTFQFDTEPGVFFIHRFEDLVQLAQAQHPAES